MTIAGAPVDFHSGEPVIHATLKWLAPGGNLAFFRAPDLKHYQLAQQLRRTLVTLDRDYLDDRRFPPDGSGGVLVIQAPDERQLSGLLDRIDRSLFHQDAGDPIAQPLAGRKLQVNTDWGRE